MTMFRKVEDPESHNKALVFLGEASRIVEKAKTVQDLKKIRDKAEAVRQYAKQAGESLVIQNHCAEIKLRAERKAGELLSDMAESGQRPRGRKKESHESTLSDLGVSRDESSRWQREAEVPAGKFESWVAERNASGEEVTQSGLLKIAMAGRKKQREPAAKEVKEEAAIKRIQRAIEALSDEGREAIHRWLVACMPVAGNA